MFSTGYYDNKTAKLLFSTNLSTYPQPLLLILYIINKQKEDLYFETFMSAGFIK